MIAWSIETAHNCGLFDHVIVSTDDAEIAAVAMRYGAEVPFLRPADLSNDYVGTTEVIAHATEWAMGQGWSLSAVCCIYATVPFLQKSDVERGLLALESGDWAYAFSVTDFSSTIYRAFRQIAGGGLEMIFPQHFETRSQDLPEVFHDAGQFYWGRPAAWTGHVRIFEQTSEMVPIPRWRVQDIDDPDDWIKAEMIFHQLKGNRV
jgi:N-acylneuraminate cytidylyltransferase